MKESWLILEILLFLQKDKPNSIRFDIKNEKTTFWAFYLIHWEIATFYQ